MLAKADLMAERFVAQLTGERPLTVVAPPGMHFETVRRREHLLAFHARIDVAQQRGGRSGQSAGSHEQMMMMMVEMVRMVRVMKGVMVVQMRWLRLGRGGRRWWLMAGRRRLLLGRRVAIRCRHNASRLLLVMMV